MWVYMAATLEGGGLEEGRWRRGLREAAGMVKAGCALCGWFGSSSRHIWVTALLGLREAIKAVTRLDHVDRRVWKG